MSALGMKCNHGSLDASKLCFNGMFWLHHHIENEIPFSELMLLRRAIVLTLLLQIDLVLLLNLICNNL